MKMSSTILAAILFLISNFAVAFETYNPLTDQARRILLKIDKDKIAEVGRTATFSINGIDGVQIAPADSMVLNLICESFGYAVSVSSTYTFVDTRVPVVRIELHALTSGGKDVSIQSLGYSHKLIRDSKEVVIDVAAQKFYYEDAISTTRPILQLEMFEPNLIKHGALSKIECAR